jgi:hypothetical protein
MSASDRLPYRLVQLPWRICRQCGAPYHAWGEVAHSPHYADAPYNWHLAAEYCLACWLIYPDPPAVTDRAEFKNCRLN